MNRLLTQPLSWPARLFILGIAVFALTATQGVAQAQNESSSAKASAGNGNSAAGKQLFASVGCSGCHGENGIGAIGPRIAPPPLPFDAFTNYVRQPTGMMRAFPTSAVSNAQLADIYAFLNASPAAKTAESSATNGNAANGKMLFVRDGCWECHGYDGQGGAAGARISPPPVSVQGLIDYVRHPSGQMPPFTSKVISDQDLTDIYAYLSSLPKPKPAKDIPLLNQ